MNKIKGIIALGPPGSNGHEAALRAQKIIDPESEWRISFYDTNADVLEAAIVNGIYAVVPVKNPTGGHVKTIADSLFRTCGRDSKARVVGSLQLPVEHCLMARNDFESDKPTHILSHPQAIAQCSCFLNVAPGWTGDKCQRVTKFNGKELSTSGAAQLLVSTTQYKNAGAIARKLAAEIYGLKIIERGIQNDPNNTTQFAILAPVNEPELMKNSLGRVKVTIVGADGGYGKWLTKFFQKHSCEVLSVDTKTPIAEAHRLVAEGQVVMFSVPTLEAPVIISSFSSDSNNEQLWLDVTSLKVETVKAMMLSQAEVVGMHPICAPPRIPSLKGQTLAIHSARLNVWGPWLASFLSLLEADIDIVDANIHDRLVMERQGLQHATTLVQASVMRRLGSDVSESLRVASPFYKLTLSAICRMHSQNPKVYAGIQIGNPHMLEALDLLAEEVNNLREIVRNRDQDAFVRVFNENRKHIGVETLHKGNEWFEFMIALLSDLSERNALTFQSMADVPGLLVGILSVIAEEKVNMTSMHTHPTIDGENHRFVAGIDHPVNSAEVHAIVRKINSSGLAKVV